MRDEVEYDRRPEGSRIRLAGPRITRRQFTDAAVRSYHYWPVDCDGGGSRWTVHNAAVCGYQIR